jgi:hypothetical protein
VNIIGPSSPDTVALRPSVMGTQNNCDHKSWHWEAI